MTTGLLISLNRARRPSPVVPVGVGYLQQALEENGHPTQLLDLCFVEDGLITDRVLEAARSRQPQLIGLSIRNVDNETLLRYNSMLDLARHVADTLRCECPNAVIVLGGAAFSLLPQEFMNSVSSADLGITGEGEQSIVDIAEMLEAGKTREQVIAGTIVSQGRRHFEGRAAAAHVPTCFSPDPQYFARREIHPGYGVQTKRGCPLHCVYCGVPDVEGNRFRLRDPRAVVDEIALIHDRLGVDRIFFTDSVFNIPRTHAMSICRELIAREMAIDWMAYGYPVGLGDVEANLMRKSGCSILNFGSDAGTDGMLRNMGKIFSPDQIVSSSLAVRRAGIHVIQSLLLGGPGETVNSVRETLDVMARAEPNVLTIAFGIRLYPKTPLWRNLILDYPELKPNDDEVLRPIFSLSKALGRQECADIADLIEKFIRQYPEIQVKPTFALDSLRNSGASVPDNAVLVRN